MEKTFANDRRTRASEGAMGRRCHWPFVLALCASALLASGVGASAGGGVHVSRLGGGPATAGRAWVVELSVRPRSFSGPVRVVASGPRKLTARARGRHGAYRARLVFPKPGIWKLTARAGDSRSKLGSVRVRSAPLVFSEPTGVAVRPDGSLLVIEFGRLRLVRVDPSTGRVTRVASLVKPWGVALGVSGSVYVSDRGWVKRIDPGHAPAVVATLDPGVKVGPVAVTPAGDVVYSTVSAVYRLAHGTGTPQRLAAGTHFAGPHGIAVTAGDALLVSDTDDSLIRRIDPNGSVSTFAAIGHPRGIAVAPDGTVYVAAADEHRIVHYTSSGARIGGVGPRFDDPYGVAVAGDGTVYAIDIGVDLVRRIAPNGAPSVLSRP
jgi:hypothetical protein